MRWPEFLRRFGGLPLVQTHLVYVGCPNPAALQVQICRWVQQGKLVRLGRGHYVVAPPYRSPTLPPFFLANHLTAPSYVSLESALAYYDLIPEAPGMVTSVTTKRPGFRQTPLGVFRFRRISTALFWGYSTISLSGHACALAQPEKALLDLFHFWGGAASRNRLLEMRFQNPERIDPVRMRAFAQRAGGRALHAAAEDFLRLRSALLRGYVSV
jgi:predicted transcriptional regulator of viral defense system